MVRFITKYFKSILLICCIITVLPYFLACGYIHPFFDDFFFSGTIKDNGVVNFIHYFYMNWSGRYSEEILMGIVNAKITDASNVQYVVFGIFVLLTVFVSIIFLVTALFKEHYASGCRLLISVTVFAFYLAFIPELFSAFYWYCSSFYELCLALILVNFGLLINLFKKQRGWGYKIAVLLFNVFLAGFSEVTVFSFFLLYLSVVTHQFFKYKKVEAFWIILLIVFTMFALLNLFSPGNLVRMNISKSKETLGFFFCAFRAAYDFILFDGAYVAFKTPFLLLLFLAIPFLIKFIESGSPVIKMFRVNPLYSIPVTVLIFYLHYALSLRGAGYTLQGRVFNFTLFFFYCAFLYNLLTVLVYFSERKVLFAFSVPPVVSGIVVLLLVVLFNMSDNNRLLWGDLQRELPTFQKELVQRYKIIEEAMKNGAKEVEVPAVSAMPKLYIFGEEGKCKTTCFANEQKYLKEVNLHFKINVRLKE